MLDLKNLTIAQVEDGFIKRNFILFTAQELYDLYEKKKNKQLEYEKLLFQLNTISKEVINNKEIIPLCENLKIQIKEEEQNLNLLESKLNGMLLKAPNILEKSVPVGKDENYNVEIFRSGEIVFNNFLHENILDIINYPEITGSRFYFLKNQFAKLERALISFAMDFIATKGFIEYSVPVLLKKDSFFRSRHLPKDSDNMFNVEDDFYLIPTGEVALVNLFTNKIFTQLPEKICTVSDCFRKEAGAAGKDTKGLIRVHQFKKCEMVVAADPLNSEKILEEMLGHTCEIYKMLNIPYRILCLCSGDLPATSKKTYDIEIPIGGRWRECASISNCGSYQALSLKARYKDLNNNNHSVHLLNGTLLAVGRTMASICETFYNNKEITIPECLEKYCGFSKILLND